LSEGLLASPLFPFATIFINILGCFLIGIALALGYISISVIGGCAATYVAINLIAPRT
jgi:fluoride ion exporter CrcB/FEX